MIVLRPFREDELGYFDTDKEPADRYNFFGFRTSVGMRQRHRENGLLDMAFGALAVDLDGTLVGDVAWRATPYGPPWSTPALNLGIQLVAAERGKGHGSAAQAQLAEYLFGVYPVNRLEAGTDTGNVAEQRALVKAGFSREGVLRGAQFRGGRFRDLVVFSRLRDDNPEKATG